MLLESGFLSQMLESAVVCNIKVSPQGNPVWGHPRSRRHHQVFRGPVCRPSSPKGAQAPSWVFSQVDVIGAPHYVGLRPAEPMSLGHVPQGHSSPHSHRTCAQRSPSQLRLLSVRSLMFCHGPQVGARSLTPAVPHSPAQSSGIAWAATPQLSAHLPTARPPI